MIKLKHNYTRLSSMRLYKGFRGSIIIAYKQHTKKRKGGHMDYAPTPPPHISKPHITKAKKPTCKVYCLTDFLFPV